VFGSSISNAQKAVFQSAATRWEQIITNDLPDIAGTIQSTICGTSVTGFPSVNGIDDVVIFANITAIDGPGGILGQAGPCATRNSGTKLPAVGIMQFDSADVGSFTATAFQDVILHEMGHVLGIGTLWKFKNLLSGAGSGGNCGATPTYTGANAKTEFATLGGSGNIPVEGSSDGSGPGTCDSHWREATFDNELMTGYYNAGVTNPLSRMTIASLKDLGYEVSFATADPYTLPSVLGGLRPQGTRLRLNIKLVYPTGTLP
jgi:hypothetical protein